MLTGIPRIMHFYWDGSPMSYLNYMTIQSFHKFNPSWKIWIHEPTSRYLDITWNSEHQKIKYIGKDYYQELKKLTYIKFNKVNFNSLGFTENVSEVFKSDFIRWYYLSTVGGGWSDFDILYLKPIDTLETENTVDTFICHFEGAHIIGFYLTNLNNSLFSDVLKSITLDFDKTQYQTIGSNLLNKLYPTIEDIQLKYPQINIKNLDIDIIYPIKHFNIDNLFNFSTLSAIKEATIGVHWYNGSNEAKIFNNTYIPEEKNITNTLTDLIENYL